MKALGLEEETCAAFGAGYAPKGIMRGRLINIQRVADVVREWEEPSFEEFQQERNAWRLLNAATFALRGRVMEKRGATPRLHKIIDGACEVMR